MPEKEIKLTGWQAVIGGVVLIGIVSFRAATFDEQTSNEKLVKEIELQLSAEYLTEHVERMKQMYESGDDENLGEYATSTKLNIKSLEVSAPLFDFASTQDVVVKVVWSLDNSSGNLQGGTEYYRYSHGLIGNTWRYEGRSTSVSFYLNFM